MLFRTFTTQTKKPGAEVVGSLPEDEEEEERSGRVLDEETQEFSVRKIEKLRENIFRDSNDYMKPSPDYYNKPSSRSQSSEKKIKKVVELLRRLLFE